MLCVSSSGGHRPCLYDFTSDVIVTDTLDWKRYGEYQVYFQNADTIFPRYDFKIIVDTSYTFPAKGFEHESVDLPNPAYRIEDGLISGKEPTSEQYKRQNQSIESYYDAKSKLSDQYVNCYPLLIFNNGKIPTYIKFNRIIQEAKDKDRKWKPIEFSDPLRGCLVNHHFFKFKPKTYDGTAIIKYEGSFKTKLRIKVEINKKYYYSNEFDGKINPSQFSHDYLKKYIDYREGSYDDYGYKGKLEKYTLLQYNFNGD